ncbi:hypothetical protein J31TS4_34180 [Paenibacillus sp. J31TS4]|uniref:hypothetical protein n=1 Tax=Paenibacillus sp. J31TS4 TaxID=2807195 RepID=UPI001B25BE0C|nr:hypothetical protein [Paenibacillus sp. J31TS4]GIP40138.1 hypothetical protein J31TS4_34180 [Paenibacillus sp. J31TS4]
MIPSRPDWYDRLTGGPLKRPAFTEETIREVEARLRRLTETGKPGEQRHARRFRRWAAGASAALLLLVLAGVFLAQLGLPVQTGKPLTPDAHLYDPATIRTGDRAAEMTVLRKEEGVYGSGSVATTFEGEVKLTGSYTYLYNGQLVFQPDEASAGKLPRAEGLANRPPRLVLRFGSSDAEALFGQPGSLGTAELVVSEYTDVFADRIEGVPNSGQVAELERIAAYPPLQPAAAALDLQSFPVLRFTASEDERGQAQKAADWLQEVVRIAAAGVSPGKLSEAERESVERWLRQVFTAERAEALLYRNAAKTQDGYLISFALVNPPLMITQEPAERTPSLEKLPNDGYLYSASVRIGGKETYRETYRLVLSDGGWRIDEYSWTLAAP